MRIGHSRASRQVIGYFEPGEILPEALLQLCQREGIRAGQLSAQGSLTQVSLDIYQPPTQQYGSAFESQGAFDLVQLTGNISMMGPRWVANLHALVALVEHGQNRVFGGQLQSATVHLVEFVIQSFDDVVLERSLDTRTHLPLFNEELENAALTAPVDRFDTEGVVGSEPHRAEPVARPEPAASPPAQKPARQPAVEIASQRQSTGRRSSQGSRGSKATRTATTMEWQEAAIKAQEILERKKSHAERIDWESYRDVELVPGDIIIHPRLGECRVVKLEDDTGAWIRIPESNRISKLALSVIKLEQVGERDGARIFQISGGS